MFGGLSGELGVVGYFTWSVLELKIFKEFVCLFGVFSRSSDHLHERGFHHDVITLLSIRFSDKVVC